MNRLQKKKWFSLISYLIIFITLIIPVIILNGKKYSFLSLSIQIALNSNGYEIVLILQSGLLIVYCVFSFIYILSCLSKRIFRLDMLNLFLAIVFVGLQFEKGSMLSLCINKDVGRMLSYLILFLTIFECAVRIVPEIRIIKLKAEEIKDNNVVNQSKLFYHIIWKNFKNNWKDYLLVLICNIVLFTVTIIAFHMMKLLDGNYGIRKIQIFNGLSEILMNAMIPMGILSVFLIIILIFYYLKMRAKNYGIFLTLGMYRKTLYYVTALEFGFVFLCSLFIGGITGRVITELLVRKINRNLLMELSLNTLGMKPFWYSIAAISVVYIISFMAAKDIFYDFNVGKSEDMRQIAEKMPGKGRYVWTSVGMGICLYSILQYRKLYQFENEYLLLMFFVGMFFIIRNVIAVYMIRERKKTSYLKNLLMHNQLYHKSRTNTGFITVVTIIQFCILFYFSFQYNSVRIAEQAEEMFPYDFICLVDESDQIIFDEISEKYEIDLYEYPMVRVTAYDSTEQMENQKAGTKTTQGQHIGISENTYHLLKQQLNSEYIKKDLQLDAKGENIYVVYQQDKSVKAQPVSFYMPRSKALLHIGNPCTGFDVFGLNRIDTGYKNYRVTGREIGSLIGSFRQGTRENIIVFSDEYFEAARDFWKTVNIRTGEIIEDEKMQIPGLTIAQGVTKLVLINVNEEDVNQVYDELQVIDTKHKQMEDELYRTITPYGNWTSGVYDSTVSYVYAKHESTGSIEVERIMKTIMSMSASVLFVVMYFIVLVVKMLSEKELNVKRQEFLKCMGMCRRERVALIRQEYIKYYCYLPIILASVSACIYTKLVFDARIYTLEDIKRYLLFLIPIVILYIIECIMIVMLMTYIYAKRIEDRI